MIKLVVLCVGMLFKLGCVNEYSSWESHGERWLRRNNYSKALQSFNRAIASSPSYRLYLLRGITYVQLGQYEEAISDYNKSLLLKDSFYGHYYLGITYGVVGQKKLSLAELSSAIEFDNKNPLGYFARGNYYLMDMCNPEQAAIDYNKAMQLDPNNINIKTAYVRAVYCQKKYRQSIDFIRQCLDEDDKSLSLVVELAWILSSCPDPKIQNVQEGFRLAKQAYTEYSTPATLVALAQAYAELGDFKEAQNAINKAIDMANNLSDIRKNMYLQVLKVIKDLYEKRIAAMPDEVQCRRLFLIQISDLQAVKLQHRGAVHRKTWINIFVFRML